MKLLKIGERIINLDQVIEAHLLEDGGVQVTFAVTAFDVADARRFSGEAAKRLWQWLEANAEDVLSA